MPPTKMKIFKSKKGYEMKRQEQKFHKICPVCNQELFGGMGSHMLKDEQHKKFFEEQKRIALKCYGVMTAKEVKTKYNMLIDEITIQKYWTRDFNLGKKQCPVCEKKLLKNGKHFNIDLSHKQFVQNEVNTIFKYYGELSINEIIKEHTLFFKRTFFERYLVKNFSKEYVCKIAHKLSGLKNKGHIGWSAGYTKETHPGVASISKKAKGRTCFIKGKTFEEVYGVARANKLKEKISDFRKGKTYMELYGEEKAKEQIENMSGKNAYAWRGGKSFEPYGLEFNKQFKEAIRERDCRCCAVCYQTEKSLGYALHVHHVNYDKQNNIPQNCISLCLPHHMLTNHNREHWTGFFQSFLKKKYGYEYDSHQKIILTLENK